MAKNTRLKAQISGEIIFRDALGQTRVLPRGPCEYSPAQPRGKVRIYVQNAEGVEFSYDLWFHYFNLCKSRGALQLLPHDDEAPAGAQRAIGKHV